MILGHQKMFFDIPKEWRWIAVVPAVVAASLTGMLLGIVGCGGGSSAARPQVRPKLTALATTTVVADLVREVAGPGVVVDCLMPPGIDPHAYRATPRDAERLAAADLVFASGLNLEGRLALLLTRLSRRGRVVFVADTLPKSRLIPVGAGLDDPHVWFDLGLWRDCVPAVADALAAADPADAEGYRARAADYAARLEATEAEIILRLAAIPADRRVLVTAHDAFAYFGRGYGLEVVGVQGTNPESEAGLGDINRLVARLVAERIPAVFIETSVSPRNVRALVEGAAAAGHAVALGGVLHSDSLGPPGSGADTLIAAVLANVDTIVAGLGVGAARGAAGDGAEAGPAAVAGRRDGSP
jgi:manganese/zinc/iron transport system substrate-binding protein